MVSLAGITYDYCTLASARLHAKHLLEEDYQAYQHLPPRNRC